MTSFIRLAGVVVLASISIPLSAQWPTYVNPGMPKLPDAIHVVTAIRAGCRTVLSADLRLKLPNGYSVLPPVAANLFRLIKELS